MEEKESLNFIYSIFKTGAEIKIDSRKISSGDIFLGLKGDSLDGNQFALSALENGAELVILDNPEKFSELKEKYLSKIILVKNSLKFLQNLAKKHRENLKIPFLGITGSNGKTTTKELVAKVLSAKYNILATSGNLNNHIGVPLTILSIKEEHNFAIIEMGANHINEIQELAEIAKPDFGIITNISPAHIGEFGSFENIIKTKKELYDEVLKNGGKIFINPKDKILMDSAKDFLAENKIHYAVGRVLSNKNFLEVEIGGYKIKTKLVGKYNIFNLQVAFTVGQYFEIDVKKIIEKLESYEASNNRSQFSKTDFGNEVIVDCYNANPKSMEFSIESFSEMETEKERVFILGQMAELGEYSEKEHRKILEKLKEENALKILLGEEFSKLEKEFPTFKYFSDLEELKKFLKINPLKSKFILLKGSNSVSLKDIYLEKYI